MTVEANLKFYCRLYHKDYSSIDCYKEDLEVATYLKRKASKLSLGMKQRVGLFIALITSDEFILLDEPTTYLDINHQVELMRLMVELKRQGKTVVTVLHDLNQASRYCDHLVVLASGRVMAQGAPEAVMKPELLKTVFSVEAEIHPEPVSGRPMCVVK